MKRLRRILIAEGLLPELTPQVIEAAQRKTFPRHWMAKFNDLDQRHLFYRYYEIYDSDGVFIGKMTLGQFKPSNTCVLWVYWVRDGHARVRGGPEVEFKFEPQDLEANMRKAVAEVERIRGYSR